MVTWSHSRSLGVILWSVWDLGRTKNGFPIRIMEYDQSKVLENKSL